MSEASQGASTNANGDRELKFVLYCQRFFEMRYMINSNIVHLLSTMCQLTILMPGRLANGMASVLPPDVTIVPVEYPGVMGALRQRLLSFLDAVFYLTYPNLHVLPNATAEFRREQRLIAARRHGWQRWFGTSLIIGLSRLASRSSVVRRGLRASLHALMPKSPALPIIREIDPDLMIACSFGLGLMDTAFLRDAKAADVPCVTLVQSWDRTSSKGYPTVHPEYAIVWNEPMRRECEVQLEFDPARIFVEGAPIWDDYVNLTTIQSLPEWRDHFGIEEGAQVIYFGCGGFGSHLANMEVVPQILSLVEAERSPPIHIIFRFHPQYLAPTAEFGDAEVKRKEMWSVLDRFRDHPRVSIFLPDVAYDGENFFPTALDLTLLLSCLKHSQVVLSQFSSQMIEAAIVGTPAISVEYGRRTTNIYNIDMKDYIAEHLLRVYRTHAVLRVHDFSELQAAIEQLLSSPNERLAERRALIEQEMPVNRGCAARATADRLIALARHERSRREQRDGRST